MAPRGNVSNATANWLKAYVKGASMEACGAMPIHRDDTIQQGDYADAMLVELRDCPKTLPPPKHSALAASAPDQTTLDDGTLPALARRHAPGAGPTLHFLIGNHPIKLEWKLP